jgi:ribonuclease HI
MKEALGKGSNNFAELMALRLLLKAGVDKNIRHIQVYVDSNLVIKWMKGIGQLLNIHLKILADQLKDIANSFEMITFTHVLREHNQEADRLSKEGYQVAEGRVIFEELREKIASIFEDSYP